MKKILKSYDNIENIRLESAVTLEKSSLKVEFKIFGVVEYYIFEKEKSLRRAHELWRATCFELFLANSKKEEYLEINFAPSKAWNVYFLKAYRAEVEELELLSEAKITNHYREHFYSISFELDGIELDEFDSYNATAILLKKEKVRTFWSLKEMREKPDFHDRGYFEEII